MNKQIAWEMSLSEITIKVHRSNLMRKMQARSVAELVRMEARLNAAMSNKDGRAISPEV
jgi:FixJ family two-component response regulator